MAKIYTTSTLFVDEVQLLKRLNLPTSLGPDFFNYLSAKSQFPKREPDFGNKRYFPAVVAWLDAEFGLADGRPYFEKAEVEAGKRYPATNRRKLKWGE